MYGYLALRRSPADKWFSCNCNGCEPHTVIVDGNSIGYHSRDALIERPWVNPCV